MPREGWPWLTGKFLANMPSALTPEEAGMNSAIWGTLWLIGLTALFSVPTGVGAAIYLEEYAGDNRFTRFIKLNIANLAGVPSLVYGILGLALFVRWLHLDRSVISGALTMSLLIFPVIITASREAQQHAELRQLSGFGHGHLAGAALPQDGADSGAELA